MTRWQQIARETVGADYAEKYAERFRALAARGDDVHGEATFVAGLVGPGVEHEGAGFAEKLDGGVGGERYGVDATLNSRFEVVVGPKIELLFWIQKFTDHA